MARHPHADEIAIAINDLADAAVREEHVDALSEGAFERAVRALNDHTMSLPIGRAGRRGATVVRRGDARWFCVRMEVIAALSRKKLPRPRPRDSSRGQDPALARSVVARPLNVAALDPALLPLFLHGHEWSPPEYKEPPRVVDKRDRRRWADFHAREIVRRLHDHAMRSDESAVSRALCAADRGMAPVPSPAKAGYAVVQALGGGSKRRQQTVQSFLCEWDLLTLTRRAAKFGIPPPAWRLVDTFIRGDHWDKSLEFVLTEAFYVPTGTATEAIELINMAGLDT